jgi:hypothetical protein
LTAGIPHKFPVSSARAIPFNPISPTLCARRADECHHPVPGIEKRLEESRMKR